MGEIKTPKSVTAEDVETLFKAIACFSNMMSEALVVLDFQNETFLHVPKHDLFLCGYSQEKVYELGFDFFKKALHPQDFPLWENIHNVILNCHNNDKLQMEIISYFAFTLRFKGFFSKDNKKDKETDYIMVYIKMKPVWLDGSLRYGVCLLSGSVVAKSGNLCVCYDNQDYAGYSSTKKTWTHHSFSPLGERERETLVWHQQGLTQKKIAGNMNISEKTVENNKSALFSKFEVNSMTQALQFASNRRLIFLPPTAHPKTSGKKKPLHPPPSKKKRNKLTERILSEIQEELNQGKKVFSIAKMNGISESTIRKAILSGKLNKNQAKKSH